MQTVPTLLELASLVIFGCCVYLCFTRGVEPGSKDASESGLGGGGAKDREGGRERGRSEPALPGAVRWMPFTRRWRLARRSPRSRLA